MEDTRPGWVDGEACEWVCTADSPLWLPERRKIITASDVATLFGVGYGKMDDLIANKLRGKTTVMNRPMWWGSRLERPNMELFAEITGATCTPANVLLRSLRLPGLGATIDGTILAPPLDATPNFAFAFSNEGNLSRVMRDMKRQGNTLGLIEMKNTKVFNLAKWNSGVPEYYWIQAQTQMFVAGLDWCVVVAKIGSDDMRAHVVLPDMAFIEKLHAKMEMWKEIVESYEEFN